LIDKEAEMFGLNAEIPVALGFAIFILFPLVVVFYSARKGHSGLAALTFTTMFAGLGPLVGLLTLLRLGKKI
jgi:hypothetical protein